MKNLIVNNVPPIYKGNGEYIFISYSHLDKEIVYEDLWRLNELGVNVWYDDGIHAGEMWKESVQSHIEDEKCKLVILYLSCNTIYSSAIRDELGLIEEYGKSYFTINVGGVEPEQLMGKALMEKACTFEQMIQFNKFFNKDIIFIERNTDKSDLSHMDRVLSQIAGYGLVINARIVNSRGAEFVKDRRIIKDIIKCQWNNSVVYVGDKAIDVGVKPYVSDICTLYIPLPMICAMLDCDNTSNSVDVYSGGSVVEIHAGDKLIAINEGEDCIYINDMPMIVEDGAKPEIRNGYIGIGFRTLGKIFDLTTDWNCEERVVTYTPPAMEDYIDNKRVVKSDVEFMVGCPFAAVGHNVYDIMFEPFISEDNGAIYVPYHILYVMLGCNRRDGNFGYMGGGQYISRDYLKSVELTTHDKSIKFVVDDKYMYINSRPVLLEFDLRVIFRDMSIYIPIRAIMRALGVKFKWNPDTNICKFIAP